MADGTFFTQGWLLAMLDVEKPFEKHNDDHFPQDRFPHTVRLRDSFRSDFCSMFSIFSPNRLS